MKSILGKLLSHVFSYSLMAALLWSVYTANSQVLNVVTVLYWILIIAAPVMLVLAFIGALSLYKSKDHVERYDAVVRGLKAFKAHSLFSKLGITFFTIVVAVALGYGGAIFTAVAYVLSIIVSMFIRAIIRDQLLAYERAIIGFNADRSGKHAVVHPLSKVK